MPRRSGLAVSPDSRLWIEGGSNLHAWSCTASTFDATIDVDEAMLKARPAFQTVLRRVRVTVPVRNLKCNYGGMDNNLYKALKADETPQITYKPSDERSPRGRR